MSHLFHHLFRECYLFPIQMGSFGCVDYRPLNAITVADVYHLPRIDEMIDKAVESMVF